MTIGKILGLLFKSKKTSASPTVTHEVTQKTVDEIAVELFKRKYVIYT